jgi:hypothetical protein
MVEINLIPFKHKHLPLVLELLKSRQYVGISDITTKTLPKIGYIAMLGDQPVACGFLRRLEPFYAQLDTLSSSAYFGSDIRHLGINKCVFALIDDAKRLKLKGIISHTSDPGILSRAQSIGFHIVEQTIIAKPL